MENKYLEVMDENGVIHKTQILKSSLYKVEIFGTIAFIENNNNICYCYSGVIDKDFNTVVPFRPTLVNDSYFDVTLLCNWIPIYGTHVGLFMSNDREMYVIDLNTVKFKKNPKTGDLEPTRYFRKTNGYAGINDEIIVIYENNNYYTYNPQLDEVLSIALDCLVTTDETDNLCGMIEIEVPYDDTLEVLISINEDGSLNNEISITNNLGTIDAVLSSEVLKNKKELIKNVKEIYTSYFYVDDSIGDDLCKILQ